MQPGTGEDPSSNTADADCVKIGVPVEDPGGAVATQLMISGTATVS